jgi:hypothetical protein
MQNQNTSSGYADLYHLISFRELALIQLILYCIINQQLGMSFFIAHIKETP